MNRLAVFDCDGTIVDSGSTICQAVQDGFAACGIAWPGDRAARGIIGLSIMEAIEALHPEGDAVAHKRLAEAYKAAFSGLRTRGLAREPLYDGIAEAIDALEERGWMLGVATGKSDRGLKHVLELHALHSRFVTLQTADRHPSKPHPSMLELAMAEAGAEPATSAMIGDTSFDMRMARNAGVAAIGVAWGYHDEATLFQAGAHAVARHPSELVTLIERPR